MQERMPVLMIRAMSRYGTSVSGWRLSHACNCDRNRSSRRSAMVS